MKTGKDLRGAAQAQQGERGGEPRWGTGGVLRQRASVRRGQLHMAAAGFRKGSWRTGRLEQSKGVQSKKERKKQACLGGRPQEERKISNNCGVSGAASRCGKGMSFIYL